MPDLYRVSGAGNDFLVLVGEEGVEAPAAETIAAFCRRGLSLGADGLFTLERLPPQKRSRPRARMIHYNADGGRSELCLNGARAAVELAARLGWTDKDGRLRLLTDSGELQGRRVDEHRVALELPDELTRIHDLTGPMRLAVEIEGEATACDGTFVQLGTPHFVVEWSVVEWGVLDWAEGRHGELAELPIETLGPALRHHPELEPEGANVHFVQLVSESDDGEDAEEDVWRVRSWERGVEGETLACGSGAVAVALAGELSGTIQLPLRIETRGGFPLLVRREGPPGRGVLVLEGDARVLARLEVFPGAEIVPEVKP